MDKLTLGSTEKITAPTPGEPGSVCPDHGIPIQVHERTILGRTYNLSSCDACDEQRRADAARAERQALFERLRSRAGIPNRYLSANLDEFWCESQAEQDVLDQARHFAETAGAGSTGLLLLGKVGTGKSFLACAILNAFMQQGRGGLYLTAMQLVRRVKATWSHEAVESEQQAYAALSRPALLVVDEVGVQFGSEAERLILNEVVNDRYNANRPTIVVANSTIAELAQILGDRVVDRFREGGRPLIFTWPSRRPQIADRTGE